MTPSFTILFVCPDNAFWGPLAEAYLNARTSGVCRALSAAPDPAAALRPEAAKLLRSKSLDLTGFQPKSWDIFSMEQAPQPDQLIFLSNAVGQLGQPLWGGAGQRPKSGRFQVEGLYRSSQRRFRSIFAGSAMVSTG